MTKNNLLAIGFGALFAILLLTPSHSDQFRQPLPASLNKPLIQNMPPADVEAASALAYDVVSEKILFEKNKTDVRPLASLTKILSSLVVLDQMNANEEVEISKQAILTDGQSSLYVGERFKARDLLAFVMVESSNDAVEALVEHLAKKNYILAEKANEWFLNLMRDKAQSLGAKTMMFYNPTGLDTKEQMGLPAQAGAVGSAEDMINIVKSTVNSELWQFSAITEIVSTDGRIHKFKPTNILAGDLSLLIGGKTGFTDIAGGNLLVIVQYPLGRPIAIVVLGSTEEGRFSDVKAIFDWIRSLK